MCWACPATHTPIHPFNDFRLHADWKNLMYAPPNHVDPPSTHPFWTLPGITRYSAQFDGMHCVEGGVVEHVAGNVLFTICYNTALLGADHEVWVTMFCDCFF
jgi:hypothetical protein